MAFVSVLAFVVIELLGATPDTTTHHRNSFLMTPVQSSVMDQISGRAALASRAATQNVLEAFDDDDFRRMLKIALPLASSTIDPSIPATELLAHFRAEVNVAESVHSFRTTPYTTQMSIAEAMNSSRGRSLWEFQLLAEQDGDAAAAAAHQVADTQGFGAMNAAEEGLFGFPIFTGERSDDPGWPAVVWPRSLAEAADRPLYSTLNLRKVDGGNDVFGPVGIVWRQKTMRGRTILTPVDTGCFEYWCNASWATIGCRHKTATSCVNAWSTKQCAWDNATSTCFSHNQLRAANCSQWPSPTTSVLVEFAGTLEHFDHLILPAAHWWNGSIATNWQDNLVGQMTRMFLRWPHTVNQSGPGWSGVDFTPATSIENFWEAEVLSPRLGVTHTDGDVKMVVGLFDELFGTEEGVLLRTLCTHRGWALVWALGPADADVSTTPTFGTNGKAIYPLNQRLLDPNATGGVGFNLSLPLKSANAATSLAWSSLSSGPSRTMTLVRTTWGLLYQQLPRFQLSPLYGLSCFDVDCIGVVGDDDDCVCYEQGSS